MSEKETGAISGAAQGAAAGAALGPAGMIAGAIIGGVGGLLSGGAAKRARIYQNRASKTQRVLSMMEAAVQRRDLIRTARIARAESLAAISAGGEGGMMSSAPLGALSSLTSQTGSNLRYFDARIRDFVQMQFWVDKAGQKAAQASNISGITSGLLSALSAAGSLKGAGGGGVGDSSPLSVSQPLSVQGPSSIPVTGIPNFNASAPNYMGSTFGGGG